MPNVIFNEAFSLSGRYFPAGSRVELSEEEAATIPKGVAVPSNSQPEENEQPEGQSTPPEGGNTKQNTSEKSKGAAKS